LEFYATTVTKIPGINVSDILPHNTTVFSLGLLWQFWYSFCFNTFIAGLAYIGPPPVHLFLVQPMIISRKLSNIVFTIEHFVEVGTTDSVAAFRSFLRCHPGEIFWCCQLL